MEINICCMLIMNCICKYLFIHIAQNGGRNSQNKVGTFLFWVINPINTGTGGGGMSAIFNHEWIHLD